MREYSINGKTLWLLDIRELAKITGLKSKSLRTWDYSGKLPKASFTRKCKTQLLGEQKVRLYLECQAEVLFLWLDKYRLGKKTHYTLAMWEELKEKWKKVTEEFLEKFNKGDNNE